MLIKYYLSNNIKAPFEDFALGLRNAWAGPVHVAAILDSSFGLRIIPGAALQMQRELQWYKVKSLNLHYFDLISQLYSIYIFFS